MDEICAIHKGMRDSPLKQHIPPTPNSQHFFLSFFCCWLILNAISKTQEFRPPPSPSPISPSLPPKKRKNEQQATTQQPTTSASNIITSNNQHGPQPKTKMRQTRNDSPPKKQNITVLLLEGSWINLMVLNLR